MKEYLFPVQLVVWSLGFMMACAITFLSAFLGTPLTLAFAPLPLLSLFIWRTGLGG